MNICFLGTPSFGLSALEWLYNNTNLKAVVVRPDKSKEISPIKEFALKHNILLFQPNKLDDILTDLLDLDIKCLITAAYGEIISTKVLSSFKYTLNLHGSILPKRRGAAPIQRAMLEGDKVLGVSLIEMTKKMDAGRIYGIKTVERDFNLNFTSVYSLLGDLACDLLKEELFNVIDGKNKGLEQEENEATYTKKILNSEEEINTSDSSYKIFLQIKAFSLKPGSYINYNNLKIKIYDARLTDIKSNNDLMFVYNKKLYLSCSDYLLEVLELQIPGKKKMKASNFINGQRIFPKRDIL